MFCYVEDLEKILLDNFCGYNCAEEWSLCLNYWQLHHDDCLCVELYFSKLLFF